jgi:hypothetical protein
MPRVSSVSGAVHAGPRGAPDERRRDPERLQRRDDRPADRPGTHHARPGTRDALRLAVAPFAFALEGERARQVLRHGEDERADVLGDRLVEDAARVRHDRVRRGEFRAHQPVDTRARGVHPARPRAFAGPGAAHRVGQEVPDQQHVGRGELSGERRLVGVHHARPSHEPAQARRGVVVEHQQGYFRHVRSGRRAAH